MTWHLTTAVFRIFFCVFSFFVVNLWSAVLSFPVHPSCFWFSFSPSIWLWLSRAAYCCWVWVFFLFFWGHSLLFWLNSSHICLFSYSSSYSSPFVLQHSSWSHLFFLWFLFISGGDRDESEDMAGDLRRTESDSVLKKVCIPAASYSPWLWSQCAPTRHREPEGTCGGAFVLQH